MGGIDNEIRTNDTQMIFSKTSLMYEQLPQRLAEDRGIDENQIKQQFQDSQASRQAVTKKRWRFYHKQKQTSPMLAELGKGMPPYQGRSIPGQL
jgi:hypothetical protein